ncbi:hypothetical protein TSUD_246040 [Trifolium subterraneum]|uniref:Uncharacterized protein n=1 Tax=Trifolium subterraneum TaxID=3900 RepID=A0A2Z6LVX3_TRISU|nr:hypothetical protein TSUD_246040 [Trifolium subterraneum]
MPTAGDLDSDQQAGALSQKPICNRYMKSVHKKVLHPRQGILLTKSKIPDFWQGIAIRIDLKLINLNCMIIFRRID